MIDDATTPKVFIEPVSAHNSETGHNQLYLVLDGQRIAKREAGAWVPVIEGLDSAEFD
jgi:hypothetical protein